MEADESGALNEFLGRAPMAEPVHSELGADNVDDFAIRPTHTIQDGEVLELGYPPPALIWPRPQLTEARHGRRLLTSDRLPPTVQLAVSSASICSGEPEKTISPRSRR